jgi:amidase
MLENPISLVQNELFCESILSSQKYTYKIGNLTPGNDAKYVENGAPFQAICLSAFNRYIKNSADFSSSISDPGHHPVTGPFCLKEDREFDCILVDIIEIVVFNDLIWCLTRSAGALHEALGGLGPDAESRKFIRMKKNDFPIAPMAGFIATNPKTGEASTGRAGQHGGNMDFPFLGPGSQVLLPVEKGNPGIWIGDLHAKQGTGELSGVAIECSGAVTMKLRPAKANHGLLGPVIISGPENRRIWYFVGNSNSFDGALKNAMESILRAQNAFGLGSDVAAYRKIGTEGGVTIGQSSGKTVTVAVHLPGGDLDTLVTLLQPTGKIPGIPMEIP